MRKDGVDVSGITLFPGFIRSAVLFISVIGHARTHAHTQIDLIGSLSSL